MLEPALRRLRAGLLAILLLPIAAWPVSAEEKVAALDVTKIEAAISGQIGKGASNRTRQLDLVNNRLDTTRALRPGGSNANSSSLAIRFNGKDAEKSAALEAKNYIAPEKARRTRRLAVWMAGDVMVDSARAQDPHLATVYTNGLVIGADARLGPRLLVGNAVGTAFDRTGIGGEGSLRSRYISNTFYGSVFTTAHTFLDFALGASHSDYSSRYGHADQDRAATQVFGLARYSREFRRDRFRFRPYGQAALSRTGLGRYDGPATGYCGTQSTDTMKLTLGMEGDTSIVTSAGKLRPHAGFEMTRVTKHTSGGVITIDDGSDDYVFAASTSASGNMVASTGIDWSINDRTTFNARYGVSTDVVDFSPQQTISASFKLRF
ncbi:hypothetical protein L598_000700001520 [Mesorhizobium sp. J18]|uniref:autotransporter outer membrane beta-barrel domain-containing protein n=1 Tax=Mesorhizobium sp. J18 TaxID=935263 RepID=UPI00119BC64F|nr:autotransporter outer membrane beta-barrel domain-containing protein [Mesorhizobium sp. J18]TWG90395.1 hypothetical protein L598_000700001520 [Mesorhizobium sp. J18]